MSKKIGMVLIMFLLIILTGNVYAEIPNESVVIGKDAYPLEYVNNNKNIEKVKAILSNLKKGEKIFIKNARGQWFSNDGQAISADVLERVTYHKENGEEVKYEKGDGDIVSDTILEENEKKELGFRVLNVAITDYKYIEIRFSEELRDQKFDELIKIGGYIEYDNIKLSSDKKSVIIELKENIETKRYDLSIEISSNIISENEEKLEEKFKEKISVLNKMEIENEVFEDYVIITAFTFNGKKIKFNKGLTFSGSDILLENCESEIINIRMSNSGKVQVKDMMIPEMSLIGKEKVRSFLKNTQIEKLNIYSEENIISYFKDKQERNRRSSFSEEEDSSIIEKVYIEDSSINKLVEFEVRAKNIEAGTSKIKSQKVVDELKVIGTVEIEGNYSSINFSDKETELKIKSGTYIKNINLNENSKIHVDGYVNVMRMRGNSAKIDLLKSDIYKEKKKYIEEEKNFEEYSGYRDGIGITVKRSKDCIYNRDAKYRMIELDILFDKDMLVDKDILDGIILIITDSTRRTNNTNIIKTDGEKSNTKFFVPWEGDFAIEIFTEKNEKVYFGLKDKFKGEE